MDHHNVPSGWPALDHPNPKVISTEASQRDAQWRDPRISPLAVARSTSPSPYLRPDRRKLILPPKAISRSPVAADIPCPTSWLNVC